MNVYEVVVNIAVVGAAITGLLLSVPQFIKAYRTKTTAGVSAQGWVNGSLTFAAWAIYMGVEGNTSLMIATIVPGLVWTASTAMILSIGPVPRGWKHWRSSISFLVALAFVTVLYFLGYGLLPAGLLLAMSEAWVYAPSVVEAWKAPSVQGISLGTWWLAVAEGVTFAVAGWPVPGAVIYGAITAPLALGVIAAVMIRQRSEASAAQTATKFMRRATDIYGPNAVSPPSPYRRRATDRVDDAVADRNRTNTT